MAVSEKIAIRHDLWRRQILSIIREDPKASRITVKKCSGLSMESTLSQIEELLQEGLIETIGKEESSGAGRRATILRLRAEGAFFIGLRFSAGGIAAVSTDLLHRPVYSMSVDFPSAPDTEGMLEAIFSALDDVLDHMGERRSRVRGIGIGAPGIIDLKSGTVVRYVHIPGWQNVPLRSIVAERYGFPTYLEHGVKCTARAFMALPEYDAVRDMLFVQMGRGINLCAVADGRIVNGAGYLSGEIGHVYVSGNERPCECGNIGCLETLVSNDAMCHAAENALRLHPEESSVLRVLSEKEGAVRVRTLCSAADSGDPVSTVILRNAGEALGETLAAAVLLMNPGKVIIEGRPAVSECFRSAVQSALERHCLPESRKKAELLFLDTDRELDAVGAAQLPFLDQFGLPEGTSGLL